MSSLTLEVVLHEVAGSLVSIDLILLERSETETGGLLENVRGRIGIPAGELGPEGKLGLAKSLAIAANALKPKK